jgi:hypothetical protein
VKVLPTITLALLLGGCATTDDRIVISDYCASYRIIRPSRQDTPETLRQVARENTKWRAVCSSPGAAP